MHGIVRRLLVPALCSTLVIVAVPVHAQVLLSNIGNVTDGDYGGTPDSSDHITTGNAALSVSAINILWESLGDTPGPNRVGIFTEEAGFASTTQVGTWFTNPNDTVTGVMTYIGSAQLSPNTTYWIVIDIDDDSEVAFTFDDSFFSDPSTQGAVIEDRSAFGDWETADWNDDSANLQFEVLASATTTRVPILGLPGMLVMIAVLLLTAAGVLRLRRA